MCCLFPWYYSVGHPVYPSWSREHVYGVVHSLHDDCGPSSGETKGPAEARIAGEVKITYCTVLYIEPTLIISGALLRILIPCLTYSSCCVVKLTFSAINITHSGLFTVLKSSRVMLSYETNLEIPPVPFIVPKDIPRVYNNPFMASVLTSRNL